jgi:hypothetical protein
MQIVNGDLVLSPGANVRVDGLVVYRSLVLRSNCMLAPATGGGTITLVSETVVVFFEEGGKLPRLDRGERGDNYSVLPRTFTVTLRALDGQQ